MFYLGPAHIYAYILLNKTFHQEHTNERFVFKRFTRSYFMVSPPLKQPTTNTAIALSTGPSKSWREGIVVFTEKRLYYCDWLPQV